MTVPSCFNPLTFLAACSSANTSAAPNAYELRFHCGGVQNHAQRHQNGFAVRLQKLNVWVWICRLCGLFRLLIRLCHLRLVDSKSMIVVVDVSSSAVSSFAFACTRAICSSNVRSNNVGSSRIKDVTMGYRIMQYNFPRFNHLLR